MLANIQALITLLERQHDVIAPQHWTATLQDALELAYTLERQIMEGK